MEWSTLEERITDVRLNLHLPDGRRYCAGNRGPDLDLYIHEKRALRQLILKPGKALGSTYVEGHWDAAGEQLVALISNLVPAATTRTPAERLSNSLRGHMRRLTRTTTEFDRQMQNHWLSRICLGPDLFHACAHYAEPGISTVQARRSCTRHLVEQLQLDAGTRVLDLNAGWGSLSLALAEYSGAPVTGRVSSPEQLQFAGSEARRRGLQNRVHFHTDHIRHHRGQFDRILVVNPEEIIDRSVIGMLASRLCERGLIWMQLTTCGHTAALGNRWYQQRLGPQTQLQTVLTGLDSSGLHAVSLQDRSTERLADLSTQTRNFQRQRNAIRQRFGERQTRQWEFLAASHIDCLQRGELRHYEILLGNSVASVAGNNRTPASMAGTLPGEIASKIPGLARHS